MIEHCLYVYNHYIKKICKAKTYAIMAHSAGGRCVAALYKNDREFFLNKVKALAFTDAYYHKMFEGISMREKLYFKKVGTHFNQTKRYKPLGLPFREQKGPIYEVSAGTDKHELTTAYS